MWFQFQQIALFNAQLKFRHCSMQCIPQGEKVRSKYSCSFSSCLDLWRIHICRFKSSCKLISQHKFSICRFYGVKSGSGDKRGHYIQRDALFTHDNMLVIMEIIQVYSRHTSSDRWNLFIYLYEAEKGYKNFAQCRNEQLYISTLAAA